MKRAISVILGCAALLLVASGDLRAQTTPPESTPSQATPPPSTPPQATPPQATPPQSTPDKTQSAPPNKITISANVGFQAQKQDVATSGTFSIYGEDGTYSGAQTVGTGVIFDVGAVYNLTKSIGVGVSWSMFSNDSSVAVTAQVPHPLFTNQFRTASGTANNANHTDSVFNLDLVYRWPFSRNIDLVFYGGPTIASIKHDVVSGISVAQETPPFASPVIDSFTLTTHTKTGYGVNVGGDAQYMFTPRFGAGAGIRYVYASASIAGANDKVKAGGFQVLGGVRVRF